MPAFNDGIADTEIPTGPAVETDVLVVGSGPAGGAAALSLATLGVPNIMITKYRWTANTPRAPTVAEAAARCGFTSAAYFSHAFRHHFGHRAGDLRRETVRSQQG